MSGKYDNLSVLVFLEKILYICNRNKNDYDRFY